MFCWHHERERLVTPHPNASRQPVQTPDATTTIRSSPATDMIRISSSIGRSFHPDNIGIAPPVSACPLPPPLDTMRLLKHASNCLSTDLALTIFNITASSINVPLEDLDRPGAGDGTRVGRLNRDACGDLAQGRDGGGLEVARRKKPGEGRGADAEEAGVARACRERVAISGRPTLVGGADGCGLPTREVPGGCGRFFFPPRARGAGGGARWPEGRTRKGRILCLQ